MAAARLRVSVATPDSVESATKGLGPWVARVAPMKATGDLSIAIVSDRRMRALNRQFRGNDAVTDVLSFPLLAPEAFPDHPGAAVRAPGRATEPDFPLPPGRRPHLGDIVISVERTIEQAEAGRGGQTGDVRWSAADELRLLATHGALHICGWDHAEPAEEAAMRTLETRLLQSTSTSSSRSGPKSNGL